MHKTISLSVPARPDYVHVLRSVLAGIGANADMSIDDIEDLRLAVDEAAAHLLKLGPTASALRVEVREGDDALHVLASVDSDSKRSRAGEAEQFVTWHILAALTDEAALEQTTEGPAIRFSKRLPPR